MEGRFAHARAGTGVQSGVCALICPTAQLSGLSREGIKAGGSWVWSRVWMLGWKFNVTLFSGSLVL